MSSISQAEQRRKALDRRMTDSGVFPFRDQGGDWVVTERRRGQDRRSAAQISAAAQARFRRVMALVLMLLVLGWMLVKMGSIAAPGWIPPWVFQPELLLGAVANGASSSLTNLLVS